MPLVKLEVLIRLLILLQEDEDEGEEVPVKIELFELW